jgi:hypothetical protein
MAVRLPVLRAGRILRPRNLQVLISVRGWVDPTAVVRLEGLDQLKRIHLIGTRTRELPACSIVPQPTMLPRAPISVWYQHKKHKLSHSINTGRSCSFLNSAVMTGVQMGETSKLRWLIGWSVRDMWADSLCFPYVVFFPEIRTSSIDWLNCVGFTWRRRLNPVSEMLCFDI